MKEYKNYKEQLQEIFKGANDEAPPSESPPKYLIKGDVSGIQEFIFNVATKGAAKSLKARSYYVQVVGDLCLKFVEKKLKEHQIGYNVLYNGGGNFFLTIDQDLDTFDPPQKEGLISELQKEIDRELKTDEIYISLSKVPIGKDIGFAWKALKEEANWNKLRKFSASYKEISTPYLENVANNDVDKKRWERTTKAIYKELINKREVIITDELVKEKFFETQLFGESLYQEFNERKRIVDKLPKWTNGLKKEHEALIEQRKQERPEEEGNINLIDFDFIAEFAKIRTGTDKLGILKMDVDSLGQLFGSCSETLSLKKLSQAFGWFFDDRMYGLWENTYTVLSGKEVKYNINIYPVFTGGDDCFFVGAWDAILEFALLVKKEFTDFAKALKGSELAGILKDDITLSAGIVIVDSKHPVVRFAELVEEALSKAKSRKTLDSEGKKIKPKNAICIMNEVLRWCEFESAKKISVTLHELIEGGESRAVLERISKSSRGYQSAEREALAGRLPFPKIWRLKYYLRNVRDEKNREIMDKEVFKEYESALIMAFQQKGKTNPMLYPIAARWTEFLTRKMN